MKRYILPLLKIFLFLIFYFMIIATLSFVNFKVSNKSILLNFTTGSISLIAAFLTVWMFLKIRKKSFKDIGMGDTKGWNKKFIFGVVCGAVIPLLIILISIITGAAEISGLDTIGAANIIITLAKGVILYLFIYSLTQEMLYRGFIYHYFKSKFSIAGAVIITSLIFGLMNIFRTNMTANGFFNIFILGIILNLLVIKDKEIWGALGFNFAWNYVTSVIFSMPGGIFLDKGIIGISLKSYSIISGGGFGILGGLITTIVLVVILMYFIKNKKQFNSFFKGANTNKNFALLFLIIMSIIFYSGTTMFEQFKSVPSDKRVLNSMPEFSNVNSYKMDLSLDVNNKTLSGGQTLNYINKSKDSLSEIYFHIYPNAYKKQKGAINIKTISVNNKKADFKIEGSDKTLLKVILDEKLLPGKITIIKMDYKIDIPSRGSDSRFGYGDNTYNLGNFFPIAAVYKNGTWDKHLYDKKGDAFYSEISNFDVSISAPKNQVIAHGGVSNKVLSKGSNKVWKIKSYSVRDFAFVSSSKFVIANAKVNGVNINSYAFNKEKAKDVLRYSINAIKLFDKKFGKYPYPSCSVVQSDIDGGMEYPTLVMITSEYYNKSPLNLTYSLLIYGSKDGQLEDVVVHELAHQWWYGLVGNDEYREAWIDEPLAQYSALQYFKTYSPALSYNRQYIYYKSSFNVFKKSKEYKNPSMTRELKEFNDVEYQGLIYVKGMFMLDALNKEIGNKKFDLFLRTLYNKYKFKEITGKEFINLTSQAAQKDMTGFYHKWLEEK